MANMTSRPVVLAAAALTVALLPTPIAVADPPSIPEPGSESAAATIGDLDDAGYDVVLQYENGSPNSPMSQCNVTSINTVGAAGSQPLAYVTISCPK